MVGAAVGGNGRSAEPANVLRNQLRDRPFVVAGATAAVSFAAGLVYGRRPRVRARRERILHSTEDTDDDRLPEETSRDVSTRALARAQNGQSSGTAHLDCPVCLGELLLPRLAPCGHTMCSPCLVALYDHERRPACPVCRKRIKVTVDKLPVNFAVKALVDARVLARGQIAWDDYCTAENEARAELAPCAAAASPSSGGSIVARIRPAWNWFKWTVIIATELGAFLVSLKEVLEAAPNRPRRYQRIV